MITACVLECTSCGHVWDGPVEEKAVEPLLKGRCPRCGQVTVRLRGHRHSEIRAIVVQCRNCGATESLAYEWPERVAERLRTLHGRCGGRFVVVERR